LALSLSYHESFSKANFAFLELSTWGLRLCVPLKVVMLHE